MDGQTDRHTNERWRATDRQCETIIPRHYHVAGYKNVHIMKMTWTIQQNNTDNKITCTWIYIMYSKTCVRQPPLKLTLVVDVERWLSYKGTCHVILLAKLHDMCLYKTDNFFHINHYLKSVSKVALLHRFYCRHNTKQ